MQEKLIKIAQSVAPLAKHLEEQCSIFYAEETPSEGLLQEPVDCLLSALEYLQTADENKIDDGMLWLDHTYTAFINKKEHSLWDRLAEVIRQDLMIQFHDLAWSELPAEKQQLLLMGLRNVHLSCTIKAKVRVVNAYFQLEDVRDDSLVDSINQRIQLLTEDSNPTPNESDIGAEKFNELQNCLEEFQSSLEKGHSTLKAFDFPEQLRLGKDKLLFNKKSLTETQYSCLASIFSDIEKGIATFNGHENAIKVMTCTIQNFNKQNNSEFNLLEFYESVRVNQPHFAERYRAALEIAKNIKTQLNDVTEKINKAVSQLRLLEDADEQILNEKVQPA